MRQANGDVGFAGCTGAGFPGCADIRMALWGTARCIGAGVMGCTCMSTVSTFFTDLVAAPFNSRLYVSGYASSTWTNGALYEFNRFSF